MVRDLEALWGKLDLCLEASDVLIVLCEDIGGDGVLSLYSVLESASLPKLTDAKRTGGICFGSSTSFVRVILPALSGHFKSTFWISSHRSIFVLNNVIRPYLTTISANAPSSTSCFNVPVAWIERVCPLCGCQCHVSPEQIRLNKRTQAVDLESSPRTRESGCLYPQNRRRSAQVESRLGP